MRRICVWRMFVLIFFSLSWGSTFAEQIAWVWSGEHTPTWSEKHVAVLVHTILLSGNGIHERPRFNKPAVTNTMLVTPVVHVEISTVNPPDLGHDAHDIILQEIVNASATTTSGWVQLDMEARSSHRSFYRALVKDIKTRIPPSVKLSVTALSWWCRSNAWLDHLEADEIVPMLFRLGKDSDLIRKTWIDKPLSIHPRCRNASIGISTTEHWSKEFLQTYKKIYLFDNKQWRNSI